MNKFVNIKYEILDSNVCNIIQKYYNINDIQKFNFFIQNNIIYIEDLDEYIYL